MGKPLSGTNTAQHVIVTHSDGSALTNNEYNAGETLLVSLSSGSNSGAGIALEVETGDINGSCGCTDQDKAVKRATSASGSTVFSWTAPSSGTAVARIAYAPRRGQAFVTTGAQMLELALAPPPPTVVPTVAPTTAEPSAKPTAAPTTSKPTAAPTTAKPTAAPTLFPTQAPVTSAPTDVGATNSPTPVPSTATPTTATPTRIPTESPTAMPTTAQPTPSPTEQPTTATPTEQPTTATPTNEPTLYPTPPPQAVMYATQVQFTLDSTTDDLATAFDTTAARDDLINLISAKMRVPPDNVSILKMTATQIPGTSRRQLVATNSLTMTIEIGGYVSQSTVTVAETTLKAYVMDTTSTGLMTELIAVDSNLAGVSLNPSSVSTSSSDSSLASILAQYEFHTTLGTSPNMLYWSVDTVKKVVTGLLLHQGPDTAKTNWIAIGLVPAGSAGMVNPSNPHRIFLYRPEVFTSQFYYKIEALNSAGILNHPVDAAASPRASGVTDVASTNTAVYMKFELDLEATASTGDVPLDIEGGNDVIWASGDGPFFIHNHRGFTTVKWASGISSGADEVVMPSPLLIYILPVLVILFNGKISPFRRMFDGFFPSLSSLVRLHPKILSGYVGSTLACYLGMDESKAPAYTYPGMLAVLAYGTFLFLWFLQWKGNCHAGMLRNDWIRALGNLSIMNMWLAILPSAKNSVVLYLTGVPYERAIKYHKIIAMTGIYFVIAHYIVATSLLKELDIPLYGETGKPYGPKGVETAYGFTAFLCYMSMFAMAFEPVRTMKYEIFWIFHQLWLVAVFFTILHVAPRPTSYPGSETYLIGFLPGLLLQSTDLFFKYIVNPRIEATAMPITAVLAHAQRDAVNSSDDKGSAIDVAVDAVCLTVPLATNYSSMYYSSMMKTISGWLSGNCDSTSDKEYDSFHGGLGTYYFINVPEISSMQYHPFSVSEIQESGDGTANGGAVTFHIKSMGGTTWTHQLARLVASQSAMNGSTGLHVHLRGPYGSLSCNICDYRHIVIVAGGIGVTPMLPILDRIRFYCAQGKEAKKAKFPLLTAVSVVFTARVNNKSLLLEFADRMSANAKPAKFNYSSHKGVELTDVSEKQSPIHSHSKDKDKDKDKDRSGRTKSKSSASDPSKSSIEGITWTTHFHLTGGPNKDDMAISTSSGASYVAHSGRPNTETIIREAEGSVSSKPMMSGNRASKACVLVCGPARMSQDVSAICADYGVDYHLETFGW